MYFNQLVWLPATLHLNQMRMLSLHPAFKLDSPMVPASLIQSTAPVPPVPQITWRILRSLHITSVSRAHLSINFYCDIEIFLFYMPTLKPVYLFKSSNFAKAFPSSSTSKIPDQNTVVRIDSRRDSRFAELLNSFNYKITNK